MKAIDRAVTATQLSALLEGRITSEQFGRWLLPIQIGEAEISDLDTPLIMKVSNLFEDASLSEDQRMTLLSRVLRVLQGPLHPDDAVELFPLLMGQDRLCDVVAKHRQGVISRTGFISFVSSARFSAATKRWLLGTTSEGLAYLCRLLQSGDYEEVRAVLEVDRE
jgi:hypothetical protein